MRHKVDAGRVYILLSKVGLGVGELYAPWLPQSATSLSRKSINSCKLGAMAKP